ncbi:MAG: FadR family transcriptional regulator [Ktedonobacteraceae bacterium]|nr:FadR family transcriptional regulator [Ktedonobacteraceae bacterium]
MPTEQNLGEQLGVSRAVVREAIKLLTASGYVRTRRGSGIYVSDVSSSLITQSVNFSMSVKPEHMMALFEFRTIQETLATRLATERITVPELRSLEQIQTLNRQAAEAEQWDAFIKSDDTFHLSIAHASHNPFLAEAVATTLRLQHWAAKMFTSGTPGYLLTSANQHTAIFTAIKKGHADAAVQAMNNHIETILQSYLQEVRKRLLDEQPQEI